MNIKTFKQFINETKIESPSLNVMIVGDIIHDQQIDNIIEDEDYYEYMFKDIKYLFSKADIIIGNLEFSFPAIFAKADNKGIINNSAPDLFAAALKKAGFTHMCIANNHLFDYGYAGHQRTIDILEKNGIVPIYGETIINKNDIKLEIYNFTTDINNDPTDDIIKTYKYLDIKAPNNEADFNIVCPHWTDYNDNMKKYKKLSRSFMNIGYEAVIGTGTHNRIRPIVYNNNKILAYSLGDFLSSKFNDKIEKGSMLMIEFTKNVGITECREYRIITKEKRKKQIIELKNINEII